MLTTENLEASDALTGFVKVWKTDVLSGETELLVDKKNMILKGGAKLIAYALAGKPMSNIWGMYIGYNNGDGEFDKPSIDIDYNYKFSDYQAEDNFGYLREPLTFTPSFLSSPGYTDNTVLFSTMITSASAAGGAVFDETSRIYEVALVAVEDPTSTVRDTVFSRTNFNPIKYDSNYNFTITWGVRILL
jgi:hypothetical protein